MVKLQMYQGGKSISKATELDDDDLLRLIKANNRDAFEALIQRHQKLVLGLAIRFLGDPVLGRDAAQDIFLSLWAQRARYKNQGKFCSYLVSITLNRCRYLARQRSSNGKKLSLLKMEADSTENTKENHVPLQKLLCEEKNRAVRQKLTALPHKTREVLILRYSNDLSLNEIAEITGMPLGTVKSHLSRGVKRLHQMLEEK